MTIKDIDFKFDEYEFLISNWLFNSRVVIPKLTKQIMLLFSKCFYIDLFLKLMPHRDLYSILPRDESKFLNLNLSNDQIQRQIHKSKLNYGLYSLLTQQKFNIPGTNPKISILSTLIDNIFHHICVFLDLKLDSNLNIPLDVNYAKYHEIELFISFLDKITSKISNNNNDLNLFLDFGGIPGKFYDYAMQISRKPIKKTRYVKRNLIPKNASGSFYTPGWISKYINLSAIKFWFQENFEQESISINKFPIIADISAGFGSFVEIFKDPNFIERIRLNLDLSSDIFNEISVRNLIYLYESDSLITDILRINNTLLSKINKNFLKASNITNKNTLTNELGIKFDILLGNPPWGSLLSKKDIAQVKAFKKFAKKQYDSFSLFTVRNILSLKKKGILYLILPETLLLNPNYDILRGFLLKNTKIMEIIHLGEDIFPQVNMPSLIIGMMHDQPQKEHMIRISSQFNSDFKKSLKEQKKDLFDSINNNHKNNTDLFDKANPFQVSYRKQNSFLENTDFRMDIFTSDEDRIKIDDLEMLDHHKFKDLVINSRGVEIGKKGKVIQCYLCKSWMAPPKWGVDPRTGDKFSKCKLCNGKIYLNQIRKTDRIITKEPPSQNHDFDRMLLGGNVNMYEINGLNYIKLGYKGIRYKNTNLYKKKKIILRKTSDKISATIDYDGYFTIQVVYQFSLKEEFENIPYMLEYILGIITSKIMDFYYSKKYLYNLRKNFPHHIQKNILNLPVPKIDFNEKNSQKYLLYVKIAFFSILMMVINELAYKDSTESKIIQHFHNFLKTFRDQLKSSGIFTYLESEYSIDLSKISKNTRISSSKDELIDYLKNRLDYYVEMLFKYKSSPN